MARKRGPSKKAQRKGGRAAARSKKSPIGGYGRSARTRKTSTKRKKGTTAGAPAGSGKNFRKLKGQLARRKGIRNPGALAASIGRKKYGAKRMAKMSAAGRKRKRR